MPSRLTWTSASGATVIDLTDIASGYVLLGEGTRGLRSPRYSVKTTEYPGMDGVEVQEVKAQAGTPTLGLLVDAPDEQAFAVRARALVRAMRAKGGPGTLTAHLPDGSTRSLTCYVTDGLEGDEVDVEQWALALKLFASDPWWYGPEEELPALLGPQPKFFPLFPIAFARSEIDLRADVDNVGDEDSYAVWQVIGPGHGLALTRHAAPGEHDCASAGCPAIALSTVLAPGEGLVIDTRDGQQSVVHSGGRDLFDDLLTDPAMWPLVPGVNDVGIKLSGVTPQSRVYGRHRPRYAGIL